MKILIIAEHDNAVLKNANLHVLTAAKELGDLIDIFIAGNRCASVIEQAKKLTGVQRIRLAEAEVYEHQLPENLACLLSKIAQEYDVIMAAATTFGKNLLPRVAALLNVGMIADVIKIISPDTFVRPMYAGNALATVKSKDKIKILTVRTTAFLSTAISSDTQPITLEKITQIIPNLLTEFVNQQLTPAIRPELTNARIIVAGGRGFKSAENFKLLEAFADSIGAAIGASRAAVDAGFAPNDYQVGQTGKIVSPELYIAIGISGAIQHLAGIKDSKIIVAINSDPDAPIFQLADYGLIGDLFVLLPELQKELTKILLEK